MGSEFATMKIYPRQKLKSIPTSFWNQKGNLIFLEQIPVDPKSGYMRQVVTYNAEQSYRVEKNRFLRS